MSVAERFGQLPDTIENEMSEYWLNRVTVLMDAEALNQQRRDDERRARE